MEKPPVPTREELAAGFRVLHEEIDREVMKTEKPALPTQEELAAASRMLREELDSFERKITVDRHIRTEDVINHRQAIFQFADTMTNFLGRYAAAVNFIADRAAAVDAHAAIVGACAAIEASEQRPTMPSSPRSKRKKKRQ